MLRYPICFPAQHSFWRTSEISQENISNSLLSFFYTNVELLIRVQKIKIPSGFYFTDVKLQRGGEIETRRDYT